MFNLLFRDGWSILFSRIRSLLRVTQMFEKLVVDVLRLKHFLNFISHSRCIEDKVSIVKVLYSLSFAQPRENKFIHGRSFCTESLFSLNDSICNNVLISVTGFLRVSANLRQSSSRSFLNTWVYPFVCIRMRVTLGRIREGSSCSEEPTSLMDNAVGLQKRKPGLFPRDSTVETIKAVLERCKYLAWYHLRKVETKINASLYGLFIFQDRRKEIGESRFFVLECFDIDMVMVMLWLKIIIFYHVFYSIEKTTL